MAHPLWSAWPRVVAAAILLAVAGALGGMVALGWAAAGGALAALCLRPRNHAADAMQTAASLCDRSLSDTSLLAPPLSAPPPPVSLAFLADPFAIPPPVLADMQAVRPFVDTLCGQIEGIQQDVEHGVVQVVDKVRAIDRASQDQRDRIRASVSGADTIRRAAQVPSAIVARLAAMLADRDRQIQTNFAGLEALADEFQSLRSAVDVITTIADKAFFLSVNAAVEAQHRGAAGSAFGLIAAEMRSLARQTAEGARDVGQTINAFAERMHLQIAAAMPDHSTGPARLDGIVEELRAAQESIVDSGAALDRMIQTLDGGHQQIVATLSDILGNLQFQDVMRQRLEQVFHALRELEDVVSRASSGAPAERSLLDVVQDQRSSYVMDSQRSVHSAVLDEARPDASEGVRIELF
ncbi:methyl-accepting chemotaxis protein [Novosphingobium huizhouense]|uniref:methyl-accepting chemotaxis protein n=1 Tax=Novosphingobium huizhouense TaxID=2866625 RepID=UPI001CD8C969|nr:methyl-accepting chemotaxis protein [Novosphingobium huizhouense]